MGVRPLPPFFKSFIFCENATSIIYISSGESLANFEFRTFLFFILTMQSANTAISMPRQKMSLKYVFFSSFPMKNEIYNCPIIPTANYTLFYYASGLCGCYCLDRIDTITEYNRSTTKTRAQSKVLK